jgi:hypothetical protein
MHIVRRALPASHVLFIAASKPVLQALTLVAVGTVIVRALQADETLDSDVWFHT